MTRHNVTVIPNTSTMVEGIDARAAFIWRTYIHLFLAVLSFTLIEVAVFRAGIADEMTAFLIGSGSGTRWLIVLGGFVVVGAFGRSFAYSAESLASQYLGLSIYVLAEALIFVPMLHMAQKIGNGTLEAAAWTTLVGFLALTAIVFTTRKNFSFLRGALRWGFLCAVALIVLGAFGKLDLGIGFSIAMIALAGGAILHDTSRVLHDFPSDRHVGAALELFASLAMLFWYVLDLYLSHSDD